MQKGRCVFPLSLSTHEYTFETNAFWSTSTNLNICCLVVVAATLFSTETLAPLASEEGKGRRKRTKKTQQMQIIFLLIRGLLQLPDSNSSTAGSAYRAIYSDLLPTGKNGFVHVNRRAIYQIELMEGCLWVKFPFSPRCIKCWSGICHLSSTTRFFFNRFCAKADSITRPMARWWGRYQEVLFSKQAFLHRLLNIPKYKRVMINSGVDHFPPFPL